MQTEEQEIITKRSLLGTVVDSHEGEQIKPTEGQQSIIRGYCENPECKFIRNRTPEGVYFIIKSEVEEFVKAGNFEIPQTSEERNMFIVIANFCNHCHQSHTKKRAKLVKRADFKLPKLY